MTTLAPSGAPTEARGVTRADVLHLGREGSPWTFVPLALAALRQRPDDAEIRFLAAAAYAALGLRSPALEELGRLPKAIGEGAAARQLRVTVDGLSEDRVGPETLAATCAANVEALAARLEGAVNLRAMLAVWRATLGRREVFRAAGGEIVWRDAGDPGGWQRWGDHAAQARGLRPPHEGAGAGSWRMAPVPGYVVEGGDPPWVLLRVVESTAPTGDGYEAPVMLVQADAMQLLDGLAQADLAGVLSQRRVRVLAGPEAGARLAAWLEARSLGGVPCGGPTITLATTGRRAEPPVHEAVRRAVEAGERRLAEALERVRGAYAGRDAAWWARRYRAAAAPGAAEPLRVLLVTSLYTTYVRHAVADLAAAFEDAGCRTRTVIEPDRHASQGPLLTAAAVDGFAPDLLVVANYLRDGLGGAVPPGLPVVTWVQDAMPHLLSPGAGRSMGGLDFAVGNIREEMHQRFGYPRTRCAAAPTPASARKFHAGPVEPARRARLACEVAYVSHHGPTARELHELRAREAGGNPAVAAMLESLYPSVLAEAERGPDAGPLAARLTARTREAIDRAGLTASEPLVAAVLSAYTLAVADRHLRHRTLGWAAEICAARGWRLHLYGRGWDGHPTLAPHARGELEHGEDLRAAYACARAHLQVSAHTVVHQRVFECALSGGLPLCLLQADDLSALEFQAAAAACRAGPPAACRARERLELGYRVLGWRADACGAGRRYAGVCEGVGLGRPEFVWLNGVHAERLAEDPAARLEGEDLSVADLLGEPERVLFTDRAGLEARLERAVGDDAWRAETSALVARAAADRCTHAALARTILGLLRSGFEHPERGDGRRWYDGRTIGVDPRPGRAGAQPGGPGGR